MLPSTFYPDWTMAGMTDVQIQILLRIDRELALQRFLTDHFIPLLSERGYTLRHLLQALGSWAFELEDKAVAHHLLDAVASLDHEQTVEENHDTTNNYHPQHLDTTQIPFWTASKTG